VGSVLVNIETMKKHRKVWRSAKVKCDLCNHERIAVYHVDSEKLECENCGNMSYFEEVIIIFNGW